MPFLVALPEKLNLKIRRRFHFDSLNDGLKMVLFSPAMDAINCLAIFVNMCSEKCYIILIAFDSSYSPYLNISSVKGKPIIHNP